MISATFRITPKLYKHMSRRIQQHSIQQAYSHFCQPARAYSSSRVKTGRFRKPQHVPKAAKIRASPLGFFFPFFESLALILTLPVRSASSTCCSS